MIQRAEDWRQRHARATEGIAPVSGLPRDAIDRADAGLGMDSYGACGMCGGDRVLTRELVASGTMRLALVCEDCGARVEI